MQRRAVDPSIVTPIFLYNCLPTYLCSPVLSSPVSVVPNECHPLCLSSSIAVFPLAYRIGIYSIVYMPSPVFVFPHFIFPTCLPPLWMPSHISVFPVPFLPFSFPVPSLTSVFLHSSLPMCPFLTATVYPQLLRSSLVNNRNQAIVCDDLGMTVYVISADTKPAKGELPSLKTKERADLVEGTSNVARLY